MTSPSDKQAAAERLVKIADAMETAEPGSAFAKELSRDYKIAMEEAGITKKFATGQYKGDERKFSDGKKKCLEKIIEALDDFDNWQKTLKIPFQQSEIIFAYNVNFSGFPHEVQFCQTDNFYKAYSGYAAIKARVSLVSVKQLEGYGTLEYGLLKFAMEMMRGKQRKEFIQKYVIPYNERIKNKKK